mmetsp:Transcript_45672/g.177827  ORF Transcript_45672/g.177827 Transcript_45672/m.177827 type:complete len:101 (+) Transcript_45672:569-871(+)
MACPKPDPSFNGRPLVFSFYLPAFRGNDKQKEWTSRKRTAKDILDGISEGGGKKPKELVEEIGLEMDEKQDSALAQLPAIDEPNKRNGIGKYRRADHGKD